MSPPRGTFIVLEGLDRTGKSTQCARLVSHLQNTLHKPTTSLRFPNRSTPTGQIINAYLSGATQADDRAIHLLFAANRWESAGEIEARIAAGESVVVDRYYYSGCVYSAAKRVEGMGLGWCREPEVGLPRPDVCVFFSLGMEEVEARGGFGEERYEMVEMQRKVRELFVEMWGHQDEIEDVVVVDAGGSVEAVGRVVVEVVEKTMERVEVEGRPLGRVRKWEGA